jgi:hypothetical protein
VEAAQRLRLEHEDEQLNAAGHLLLFLAEPLSSRVYRYKRGSDLWTYLAKQHNVWLSSRGVVLQREQRMLRPRESECVAAYCRRAFQLQEDLANANRAVADVVMVEAVLDGFGLAGLERERPEWPVVVQDLQAGLTGRETVDDIQPDLVRLEVKVKMRSEPHAAAARANNTAHAESELQALKAQVEQLSAQLRTLEPPPSCPSNKAHLASGLGPMERHNVKGASVDVNAAERQTTKFGTARFQSNVIPLLVKARSDAPLLQCVGFCTRGVS